MPEYVFYLVVGRVCVYLVQTLPPVQNIKNEYLHKLFNCDLCLGFWVYLALASFSPTHLTIEFANTYVPVLSQVITAALSTTLVHYVSLGWQLKHGTFIE